MPTLKIYANHYASRVPLVAHIARRLGLTVLIDRASSGAKAYLHGHPKPAADFHVCLLSDPYTFHLAQRSQEGPPADLADWSRLASAYLTYSRSRRHSVHLTTPQTLETAAGRRALAAYLTGKPDAPDPGHPAFALTPVTDDIPEALTAEPYLPHDPEPWDLLDPQELAAAAAALASLGPEAAALFPGLAPRPAAKPVAHYFNPHWGIGDAATALWGVAGAVDAGLRVIYYGAHPGLVRHFHPDVAPRSKAPPGARTTAGVQNAPSGTRIAAYHARTGLPGTPRRPALIIPLPEVPSVDLLVAPHSRSSSREWPKLHLEHFRQLLGKHAPGITTAVLGGSDREAELSGWGTRIMDVPAPYLLAHIRAARVLFAIDSGPSHLAALFRVPSLIAHAQTRPDLTLGAYPDHRTLYPEGACSGCNFQSDAPGWIPSCSRHCTRLAAISPYEACTRLLPLLAAHASPVQTAAA